MFKAIQLIFLVGVLAWAYQVIQPPPVKVCGSPGGPPVTSPRIRLGDGRYLAYKEHGVPKDGANYKIIFIHGLQCSRHDFTFLSQEFAEELGIYVVSFDRAGYGESDPNPNRTVKNTVLDIEELADQLGLGSKFYVMGYSMGGQVVWSCLKYIPHRLLGAALLTPAVNYWWPGFPATLSAEVYKKLLLQDKWAYRVMHYIPWLTYWWNTQKLFPGSALFTGGPELLSGPDREVFSMLAATGAYQMPYAEQGDFESVHRDLMVGFSKWEFSPMELENPFPNNESSVHLWQGDQDFLVPAALQRYISKKLPWIQYHEVTDAGHLFPHADGMAKTLFRTLLGKQKQPV